MRKGIGILEVEQDQKQMQVEIISLLFASRRNKVLHLPRTSVKKKDLMEFPYLIYFFATMKALTRAAFPE